MKPQSKWMVSVSLMGALVSGASGSGATGTIQDVQHVVIFVQENRSFDHYFGSLNGVRGFADRNMLLFQNGKSDLCQPQGTNYVLPFGGTNQCLGDLGHGWGDSHIAWNGGKWDQWIPAKGTQAMTYLTRNELGFYYALANAYTVCDGYYCSVMGPTWPNRLYLMTGMIDPAGTGGGPVIVNAVPTNGLTWTTYPERLQAANVSWRVYQEADNYDCNELACFAQYRNALPGNPLYDLGMARVGSIVTAFQADVSNATLPRVSWIITTSALSEHPYSSPASGAQLTQRLLNALASNPSIYSSTVFILTYDEAGGFFDHIPPPFPPSGTSDEFVNGQPIGPGVRVPMIVVSPWTRGGHVCSQTFDHTSILRFLEVWTGVSEPNISAWRRQVCGDLTSAFDFSDPDPTFPSLPLATPLTCTAGVFPPVPSPQAVPVQEAGTSSPRPLPYQPNVNSYIECATGRLHLIPSNGGAAPVSLAIYPNAFRTDGPWPYVVGPPGSPSEVFVVGSGPYDFTCYGPNGFQRRFAGKSLVGCSQFEVVSCVDPGVGGLALALQNFTASPVTFTITNGYPTGGPWTYTVPANSVFSNSWPVLNDNNGWYDLTVTSSSDNSFARRLAGRVETSSPASPGTLASPANLLSLAVTLSGTNLVLKYPVWASGYTLEFETDLANGIWTDLGAAPITNAANCLVVTVPLTNQVQYYRLRQ
jgi:phospholipase C